MTEVVGEHNITEVEESTLFQKQEVGEITILRKWEEKTHKALWTKQNQGKETEILHSQLLYLIADHYFGTQVSMFNRLSMLLC